MPPDPPCSSALGVGLGDACSLPDFELSHIYTSGEYELTEAGLPDHSLWAQRLGCKAQSREADVVDTNAGYVWDSRSPQTRNTRSGRQPRPGRAQVFVYPECRNGHVVADVIRLGKGHTEGLEPNVTERVVQLMMSARAPASRRQLNGGLDSTRGRLQGQVSATNLTVRTVQAMAKAVHGRETTSNRKLL